jgi:uncharacterized membrane protein
MVEIENKKNLTLSITEVDTKSGKERRKMKRRQKIKESIFELFVDIVFFILGFILVMLGLYILLCYS